MKLYNSKNNHINKVTFDQMYPACHKGYFYIEGEDYFYRGFDYDEDIPDKGSQWLSCSQGVTLINTLAFASRGGNLICMSCI